jgi:hypothetical protein
MPETRRNQFFTARDPEKRMPVFRKRTRAVIISGGVLFGAAILLMAGIQAATAQIPSRGNIRIVNLGNSALSYKIRPNNGVWTQQRIERGGTASFDCTGCVAFETQIETPGHPPLTRTLPLNQRYQIFWNDAAKAWDIGSTAAR